MNCGIDLMHPAVALDACLAVINNTPNWPQLLAYGVATVAIFLLLIVTAIWVVLEATRRAHGSQDQTLG